MSVQRAVLLIADISGYTRFMKNHRMSLAHAQDIVGRLLEAIVDAPHHLKLAEIEGDAAFFYAPCQPEQEPLVGKTVAEQAIAMHLAFHRRQQELVALNLCKCDGCAQTGRLQVKFVAHVGDVASQKVKRSVKPAGVDVILVHRLLKNSVPIKEYILMSEAVFRYADERIRRMANALKQELEGLGEAQTHFVDIAELAGVVPPAPSASRLRQIRTTLGVLFRGMPYLIGIKKPSDRLRAIAGG